MNNQLNAFDKEGAYVFSAPTKISFHLNRELVVILNSPEKKITGAVRYNLETPLKELVNLLNLISENFRQKHRVNPKDLKIKIFGLSNQSHYVSSAVHTWAKETGCQVVAEDVGRGVTRTLLVDCETGKVGVSYAETFIPGDFGILATGSASRRSQVPLDFAHQILVLANNQVGRQLCQQAIESIAPWTAIAPEMPFDILTQPVPSDFICRAVVIHEDVGKGKPVERWTKSILDEYPQVGAYWIGKTVPKFAKGYTKLATFTPDKIATFKKEISRELGRLAATESTPGTLLAFPTKKKRA